MASLAKFDTGAAPEDQWVFDLLPEDYYLAVISESDVKQTKSGSGSYLALTFDVISDGFKGRKVWKNINVQNNSAEAQRIGQAELANVKASLGMGSAPLQDSVQLHGKPMCVRIVIDPAGSKSNNYPGAKDRNEIKAFFPAAEISQRRAGGAPAQAAHQPAAQPVAAPKAPAAASATPPWMKRAA